MFPLDIDMGEANTEVAKLSIETSKSKLPKPVQQLVTMIFDIGQ